MFLPKTVIEANVIANLIITFFQALCHDYFFTPPSTCCIDEMPKPANLKSCIPDLNELEEILRDFNETKL